MVGELLLTGYQVRRKEAVRMKPRRNGPKTAVNGRPTGASIKSAPQPKPKPRRRGASSGLETLPPLISVTDEGSEKPRRDWVGDSADERASAEARQRHRPNDDFVGCEFQAHPESRPDGVFAPRWAMEITRTRAELLVLAQLAYWLGVGKNGRVRAKIDRDGYFWVAKTYGKLGRELSLTKHQVRAAIRTLKGRGLIVSVEDDDHRVRYRLNADAIRGQVEAVQLSRVEGRGDD